jgi:hypothetical protein
MPAYVSPPSAPGLTPLPQSGVLDTILNTTGAVGAVASQYPDFEQRLAQYRRRPIATNAGMGAWDTEGVG